MTHADSKPISRYFQCSNVYRVQQTGFTNPISWSYLDVLVSNYSCLHCFYTDFTDFSKKLVAILKIMQIFLVWNEFHLCTYYHPKLFCYNFMLKNSHPHMRIKKCFTTLLFFSRKFLASSILHARKIFRKTYPLIRTCTFANQGVRNLSFLKNFALCAQWIIPFLTCDLDGFHPIIYKIWNVAGILPSSLPYISIEIKKDSYLEGNNCKILILVSADQYVISGISRKFYTFRNIFNFHEKNVVNFQNEAFPESRYIRRSIIRAPSHKSMIELFA